MSDHETGLAGFVDKTLFAGLDLSDLGLELRDEPWAIGQGRPGLVLNSRHKIRQQVDREVRRRRAEGAPLDASIGVHPRQTSSAARPADARKHGGSLVSEEGRPCTLNHLACISIRIDLRDRPAREPCQLSSLLSDLRAQRGHVRSDARRRLRESGSNRLQVFDDRRHGLLRFLCRDGGFNLR